VYSELGSYSKAVSDFEAAVDAQRVAGRLIESIMGAESEDYAVNLCNIAGSLRLWGKLDEAEKYFVQSKTLFEKIGATADYYYASVINNIGLLCQDRGEDALAIEHIERSIEILKQLDGVEVEIATALTNLASLHRNVGQDQRAVQSVDTAIAMFEALPPNPHHAAALNAKAMLLFRDGDYVGAKALFGEALKRTEGFFGQNVEYAIACESLAAVSGKLGEAKEQASWLDKAIGIFVRVFGEGHERPQRLMKQRAGIAQPAEQDAK
jgi:tetratricopeptide (TPR) repeat protein